MSQDLSFRRKVIYIVTIVLLLFPLFWIGQPATRNSPGGILARLRAENNLSQANLGDIDPASESMKLATLGLRGVAANVLWEKAHRYKKKEDWDSLSATLNQITKLQPNFITVWEHQAHNLSYNISVEFDDYRHRYHWVKKGISFLVEGIHYNRDNPRLLHYTGWITGQKMGRADEHVQFREMFREDDDFHAELNNEVRVDDAAGYGGRPDSWLVSRLWYLRAEESPLPLKGKSPLIFYADSAMALINYASTIEEEGILGQEAQRAWSKAGVWWEKYGQRPIPTSWGHNVLLGDHKIVNDELDKLRESFEELAPGVRDLMREEKVAKLSDEERAALDVPDAELTEENYQATYEARSKVAVTFEEAAERAPEENRAKAIALAARLRDTETMANRISHYRGIINYDYWEIRCAAEQTKTAVDARECIYRAKQYQDDARLEDAREQYESAWRHWRKIFDEFPRLKDDVAADDLITSIQAYDRLMQQLDEEIPTDFPLIDFLEIRLDKEEQIAELYKKLNQRRDEEGSEANSQGEPKEDPTSPPVNDNAADEMPAETPPSAKDVPAKPAPADVPPADVPPVDEAAADKMPAGEGSVPPEQPAPTPTGDPESKDGVAGDDSES